MRRVAACFAVLTLAACSSGGADQTPPTPEPAMSSAPARPLATIESLAGEWRVAGIDGEPLDEPYGIALSANRDEIWWEPRCAGIARSYAIRGLRFSIGPAVRSTPSPAPGAPPPVVCAIGLPPRLADVSRALDAADTIGRTPENGVAISGGGHSLLLFSQ